MIIRNAVPADAEALARIHVDTWKATYRGMIADSYLDRLDRGRSEQGWRASLTGPSPGEGGRGAAVLVADDEEFGVLGFASFGPNRDKDTEHEGELYAIYVLPDHQAKGVGRMLLAETMRSLSDCGLRSMVVWVLSTNPARRFYEKMGGKEVRQRKVQIGGVEYDETSYGWADICRFGHTG